ncbi:unnamed protein product [Mytilus coruscus]|uniref:Uncharacterized protein n=1 Tax=Mytilus coruscus TaxID=42192 RepID=A0A6J8BGE2_MYTCO|nr:unnamed protein product [Mytilus coruscus]
MSVVTAHRNTMDIHTMPSNTKTKLEVVRRNESKEKHSSSLFSQQMNKSMNVNTTFARKGYLGSNVFKSTDEEVKLLDNMGEEEAELSDNMDYSVSNYSIDDEADISNNIYKEEFQKQNTESKLSSFDMIGPVNKTSQNTVDVSRGNEGTKIDSFSLFPPNVEDTVTMNTISPTAVYSGSKELFSTGDEEFAGDIVYSGSKELYSTEEEEFSGDVDTVAMNTRSPTAEEVQNQITENNPSSFEMTGAMNKTSQNTVDVQRGNKGTKFESFSLFSPNVEDTVTINTMSSEEVQNQITENNPSPFEMTGAMKKTSQNTVDVQRGNKGTKFESFSLFSPNVEDTVTINTMSPVYSSSKELNSTEDEEFSESSGSKKLNITVKEEYFEDMDMFVDVQGKREGTNESFSFSTFTEDNVTMNTRSPTAGNVTEKTHATKKGPENGSPQRRSVVTRTFLTYGFNVLDCHSVKTELNLDGKYYRITQFKDLNLFRFIDSEHFSFFFLQLTAGCLAHLEEEQNVGRFIEISSYKIESILQKDSCRSKTKFCHMSNNTHGLSVQLVDTKPRPYFSELNVYYANKYCTESLSSVETKTKVLIFPQ